MIINATPLNKKIRIVKQYNKKINKKIVEEININLINEMLNPNNSTSELEQHIKEISSTTPTSITSGNKYWAKQIK